MYYLSIDCANKSLAIGLYNINNLYNWKYELLNILKNKENTLEEILNKSNNFLENIIDIKFLQVIDLIPNRKVKDTTIIERSIVLKNNIKEIKKNIKEITNEKIKVLIEYQMNSNDKSRCIYNQLIYCFSNTNYYELHIVIPTLKNQIYFSEELKYCKILQRYSKTYTANKIHSKENFLYFINKFNKQYTIQNIKKKNLDDIADTFMQLLGYIIYNDIKII